jgi:hypothetical protein
MFLPAHGFEPDFSIFLEVFLLEIDTFEHIRSYLPSTPLGILGKSTFIIIHEHSWAILKAKAARL